MRRLLTIAAALCMALTILIGLSGAADQLTPVLMSVASPPSPVRGTDGLIYLQYELVLVNYSGAAFRIDRIEVLDARTRRVLSDISGKAVVTRVLAFAGRRQISALQPGQTAFALVFPAFRTTAEVPRAATNRITLTPLRTSPLLGSRVVLTSAPVPVDFRAPIVLGPPLEGSGWAASGSCCLKAHAGALLPINGRLYIAQRYAIDWIRVDNRGRAGVGDAGVNRNWFDYGAKLLAVRDGTVVSALDGLPERKPGQLPSDTTLQNATGNHVILDIGGGAFVFYAHMQPGSIRVKVGQRVRRGKVLGLLGNSGNTTAPHLHIHVMDGPSPLGSHPVPYVFDRLVVRGRLATDVPDDQFPDQGTLLDTRKHGPQRRVLPMHNWVVDFPPARR